MKRVLVVTVAVAVASTAVPLAAHAQDRDPTTAEALFFAGREAMDRGDFADACPKFAESDRLDPGAGTRINLADCEERLGHPAAAWRHWRESLELLPASDERRPIVRDRIKLIEPRIPRLTVKLASPVKDARIDRDGFEIGIVSMGLPLPVEPGDHTIRIVAPGREPNIVQLTLAEGERRTVAIEPGRATDPTAAPPAAAPKTSALRPAGMIAIGVGSASIAASAVFGLLALSAKSDLEPNCFPSTVCNDEGADAASRGSTFAAISTVTFITGAALLAGGITLVATHPKLSGKAATVFLRAGGLGIGGRF